MADILIKHLVKRFGKVEAVSDVSLQIADGEFLVLLGPSGCGKSTILRVVAGLEDADSGRDRDRRPARELHRPGQAQRGDGVPELRALPAHDRVQEHRVPAPDREEAARPRSTPPSAARPGSSALEELLHRCPGQLSGGQRQRVALARAIVREPQAFLMDEPLSNLDAQLRIQTRLELIQLHARLGITTMYVTHDQVEAMTMGHRIAVMSEGVLQQIGTPQDVYRAAGERLRRDVPRRAADEPDRRRARGGRGGGWRFRGPGRRRAALDRGAQPARARARDRGERRGQARPAPGALPRRRAGPGRRRSPAACGSSSRSAPTST